MKQFLVSLSFVLLVTSNVRSQTLETVTTPNNTTTNAIWITGFGNYSKDVDAVGLYYFQNKGYLDAMNPSTAIFRPLVLRGSLIEMSNRVLMNNAADNGYSALSVHGEIRTDGVVRSGEAGQGYVAMNPQAGIYSGHIGFHKGNDVRLGYMGASATDMLYAAENGANHIFLGGNVGIGTLNPNGYKLAVAGTAIAQKVKVIAAATNWPDYVFHKEYVLPSLQDVAQYIATHQHLPEIPSASEIEKNGLDLGEMNKQLLKKVEELTLYIIQQQQETEGLKARVKALERK